MFQGSCLGLNVEIFNPINHQLLIDSVVALIHSRTKETYKFLPLKSYFTLTNSAMYIFN